MRVEITLDHDQPQRPADLAALHREVDVVAAGIAGDDLEFGAEHRVGDARELVGVGRRAGAADHQLLLQQLSSNLVMPEVCQLTHTLTSLFMLPIQRNLVGSNFAASMPSIGSNAGAASDDAERGAVLGRDVVEPVGEHQAAGARHVARNDRRIARDVLAHMAREQAAHRRRSRRRRCSRSAGRRSCPCRNRRRSGRVRSTAARAPRQRSRQPRRHAANARDETHTMQAWVVRSGGEFLVSTGG